MKNTSLIVYMFLRDNVYDLSKPIFNEQASLCKRLSRVQSKVFECKNVAANQCKSIKPIPLPIKLCRSRQNKASSWQASTMLGKFLIMLIVNFYYADDHTPVRPKPSDASTHGFAPKKRLIAHH